MSTSELEADVQELKSMLEKATRPNVRKELERVLISTELELQNSKNVTSAIEENGCVVPKPVPAATPAPVAPKPAAVATPASVPHKVTPAGPWTEITTFALDLGGYDKPNVTVDMRLKGIEAVPAENITCDFTESSFDVKIIGYEGKNWRFLKTNLDKDIKPADSNVKVKKNHVVVTLAKVKGEYGYDSWSDLCAKGKRKEKSTAKSDNPQDSIMSMMKDMYDDGDDNMKKVIGEAMYKAKRGEKYEPNFDDVSPK